MFFFGEMQVSFNQFGHKFEVVDNPVVVSHQKFPGLVSGIGVKLVQKQSMATPDHAEV